MVAIHTPIDKGTVYTPVTKTCRVATDRGMIWTPKNWVRINDLSTLEPEGKFRRVALDAAKRFVADMEKQGFSLITPESNVLVYGPIRHRDFSGAAMKTSGFDIYEEFNDDAEDFLLRAEFLAKKVHMAEYLIKEPESA